MLHKPRLSSSRSTKQSSVRHLRRLFFEPLEERRVLAIDAALIGDIAAGADSGASGFTQFGSNVYFSADDGAAGMEIWRSNGTTASLFADLHPSGSSNPRLFAVAGGKLFFAASTPTTGIELWATDGFAAPQVFNVRAGSASSSPTNLTSFDGELYFVADGGSGRGVWHTNGVAAPVLVPGTAAFEPSEMLVSGGKLYFCATPTATPTVSRIYTWDGTTLQVLNITSGSGSYGPVGLVDFGGTVYFSGFRGSPATGQELFKVTGPTSVDLVMDIRPGPSDSSPSKFTVAGTNLFFKANNGTATNLWRTFSGGTQKVTDPIGVTVPASSTFASIGSTLYFVGTSASGTGIFTSDGTTITSLPLTIAMSPDQLTNVGGVLYFAGTKAGFGRELFYLNGSTPTLVRDIQSGSGSSSPDLLTAVGTSLYFSADDGATGIEPWIAKDFPSPQTISQDASGNLVVTDNVNGTDDITIQTDGSGGWTIFGNGAHFGILSPIPAGITATGNTISIPASAAGSFGRFIFNTAGGSDKLTVKLDSLAKRVDYDGGESGGDDDRLVVQSVALYASETSTLTSNGGGDLDFGSDGSVEVHFANLEPVDTTGVAIASKIINLPANSTATLKDYLSPADGFMQLAFNGTGPEDERFQNPSTSLTINATGGGSNLIQFETPDNGFAPATLNLTGSSAASDTFRLATGFPGVLPNVSNVVMTSATLDLNNQNETIGSLAGNGAISLGSGTLTTGNATSTTFSGTVGGSRGLVKQGTGAFTLSGSNNYTGTTLVSGGSLLVDGSLANGAAAVDLTAQTGGTLGGTGSIAGNVSIASGGKIDAGVGNAGGTLALNNGLALATGSTFAAQIGGNTAGDGVAFHDQVAVQSTVSLGGAFLSASLINSFIPAGADRFVLITNDGSDAVSGTFGGLPEGAKVIISGVIMYVTYAGDSANSAISGNDVILSVQPVINGTPGPDTVTVTPIGGGNIQVTYTLNGVGPTTLTTTAPAASFTFHGGGGDDSFVVNLAGSSNPLPALIFDGEGQDLTSANPPSLGDVVAVNGTGVETATYLSDPAIPRAGKITIEGIGVLNFLGTEPANMFGMAVANVTFANGNDVITLANGFGATPPTFATPAIVVSGTSGGVAFEQIHLSGNTTVNLNTVVSGSDGNDTITINSADNAHANISFNIRTGVGTDTVAVNGNLAVSGDLSILSQNISLAGGTLSAGATSLIDLNSGIGAITTTGSGVDVVAQDLVATATSGIDLDTSVLNITASNSGAGNITVDESNGANLLSVVAQAGAATISTAGGNLNVSSVSAMATATLIAAAGAITDANGPVINVTAASLALGAASGIGSVDALETAVSNLAALNTASGNIAVVNSVGGLLTLANVAPVTAGFALRNTAPGGQIAVTNGSPLVVAANVSATGIVILSAGESGTDDVDNLTVNAGVTVQSTGSSVTLNSGDNTTVSSTSSILAATTITINIDSGDLDATGEMLSIATGAVITAPGGATFNAGSQSDTFSFAPQLIGTVIVVNGGAPFVNPGDVLNLDLVGAAGTTLNIDGVNDGTFTFTNRASVEYNSIESLNPLNGCCDLVLNMAAFGPGMTVRRGAPAIGTTLEIVNNAGPAVVFSADLADIASLKVNGTAGADTLTVDDVNGMVSFDPACIPSVVFPDNSNSTGVARFYFDGAGGANALNFQLTENGTAQIYAIGNGAAPGAGEGEVLTTNAGGRNLVSYFSNLGPAGSVNRAGTGAAAGSLIVLGDANGNTLNTTAAAGLTTVNPLGYTPFTFAPGGNYSQLNLQAAGGDDTYNINGAGAAGLDNLLIPAVVTDASGVDSLFVNDSTDATGDVATVTHTGINGLSPVAGDEITFAGIETLDVTGTSAGDSITTSLGGAVASPTSFNGLLNVNVRGNGGTDNMFLHVADSFTDATLNVVNLFGDAGGDNFGGAAAADHIRPVLATGQTQIIINGDANAKTTGPVNPGTDPVITSPDHLFVDLTTTDSGAVVNPVVIVDTNGGYADAANTVSFRYNGIEDIDLFDGGVLTNTAIGDFYLRATDLADYIQFVSAAQVNPVFRIRIGNIYYPTNGGNYGPYTTSGPGAGKIFVYGRGGIDTITMYNTRLNAAIFGEGGDDILTGGYGDDLIVGGAGNDRINGGAVGGNDDIWGDDFNPAIDNPAVASQTGTGNDQINTFGGNDTVYGQGGNDIINTGGGDDYINGGPGDDQIDGQAGNDRIYGGSGVDTASGSEGNDVLAGNDGNDSLFGRAGNDILIGGLGLDNVNGNEGNDVLVGDESSGAGSNSLAKGDAADAALLALMAAWGPAPTLASLGGFNSAGPDGSVDTLWGGTEADAFFGFPVDNAADRGAFGYGPDLN